ncbi:MAG TPA: hypothetical protein VMR33_14910 [Candidatus Baltobacteraceae bacterium]|jgi:hypothetical protein|nr:hypothetical protein [Candidatus Baltobacteraceae bacterium]
MPDTSSDSLFKEYSAVFEEFDDLTLARWLAQTLGQLRGRVWRFSHPLVGAYRLGAEIGHRRQIWLKRLAGMPQDFAEAPCCRAPSLPLFSRDILQSGLICQHCSETLTSFEDLPADLQISVKKWADDYAPVHAVAHWEDNLRRSAKDYDQACEDAAGKAEKLLAMAGSQLLPPFLEHYSAIIWEDQDECLEVRPEDIVL